MQPGCKVVPCFLALCACVRVPHSEPVIRKSGNVYTLLGNWTRASPFDRLSTRHSSIAPGECSNSNNTLRGFYNFFQKKKNCCHGAHVVFPVQCHFKQLMNKWANKRVGFFGDSLTQQLIDAIAIFAESNHMIMQKVSDVSFKVMDYNITIARECDAGCGIVVPPRGYGTVNGDYTTSHEVFQASMELADVFYVNVGLHLHEHKELDQIRYFDYLRRTMEDHLATHPWKQHFYRLTYPQHFEGPSGTGVAYEDRSVNDFATCTRYGVSTVDHSTSRSARAAFAGSRIKVLDYFPFLQERGDLHKSDCSHFCWDYEMFKGIWYMMDKALVE